MADTILLFILITGFSSFLVYISLKKNRLTKRKIISIIIIGILLISSLWLLTGTNKVKSDISRVIHNSSPKKATEVYTLLFKEPINNCITFINFKDQVIPKFDCCIWMEIKICPSELNRLINLKRYRETKFNKSDSLNFLLPFNERPAWWTPQILGDSLTKLSIKFDEDNEQSLFFGKDSTHAFICDQAL